MRLLFHVLLLAVLWPSATAAAFSAPPETIRVRLFEDAAPRTVELEATTPLAVFTSEDPEALVTLAAGQRLTLRAEALRIRIDAPGLTFYAPTVLVGEAGDAAAPVGLRLRLDASGKRVDRGYAGSLRIGRDGDALRLILGVDLETYVAGVVQREYGLDDDEGTRAMAILARTYALYTRGRLHADYDVVDHVGSQVYHGTDGVTSRVLAAVAATRGQVLMWEDELAEAVYSASNGGVAASNQEVWAGPARPYLQTRPDPYDRVSPHSTWTTRLDRSAVLRALSDAFGRGVKGFLIDERTPEGRVARVTLQRDHGDRSITGFQFRKALSDRFGVTSIRSTLFDARREGNRYVFEGRGFGHGVGMSQWGAHGQALEGRTAEQILAFYYPGTRLATLDAAAPLQGHLAAETPDDAGVPEATAEAPPFAEASALPSAPPADPAAERTAEPVADAGAAPARPLRVRPTPMPADPAAEPVAQAAPPSSDDDRPVTWTDRTPREKQTTRRRRGW